jgi:hypothetical protein
MKVNISLRECDRPSSIATSSTPAKWNLQQALQPGYWVRLLELPSPLSFNEALLLCQCSDEQWVAWIPDHGEAILDIKQFE